jgi:hypothetical protein
MQGPACYIPISQHTLSWNCVPGTCSSGNWFSYLMVCLFVSLCLVLALHFISLSSFFFLFSSLYLLLILSLSPSLTNYSLCSLYHLCYICLFRFYFFVYSVCLKTLKCCKRNRYREFDRFARFQHLRLFKSRMCKYRDSLRLILKFWRAYIVWLAWAQKVLCLNSACRNKGS